MPIEILEVDVRSQDDRQVHCPLEVFEIFLVEPHFSLIIGLGKLFYASPQAFGLVLSFRCGFLSLISFLLGYGKPLQLLFLLNYLGVGSIKPPLNSLHLLELLLQGSVLFRKIKETVIPLRIQFSLDSGKSTFKIRIFNSKGSNLTLQPLSKLTSHLPEELTEERKPIGSDPLESLQISNRRHEPSLPHPLFCCLPQPLQLSIGVRGILS